MNTKAVGERAETVVIGELAKWGIDVAVPLSDNYPFDFIVIGEKLLRAQVKSSSVRRSGSVSFKLTSSNWYKGTTRRYSASDCDVMICLDLSDTACYLLSPDDFAGRSCFTIRKASSKNRQVINTKNHDDFVLSTSRIERVLGISRSFGFPLTEERQWGDNKATFERECKGCHRTFQTSFKSGKYCSPECGHIASRKCDRPDKEQLRKLLSDRSWLSIARDFNVSDNAVRKWAKQYGLMN